MEGAAGDVHKVAGCVDAPRGAIDRHREVAPGLAPHDDLGRGVDECEAGLGNQRGRGMSWCVHTQATTVAARAEAASTRSQPQPLVPMPCQSLPARTAPRSPAPPL